ncbi:MAG: FtsQ-type POTRA domain-containing protein, partial [Cyanobacteria bacterium NC_groundwater_1444_Ag_S-0.65um_54_12]|nr:FtsQ-type POTRA domain-containing protein [Cyanobacteria bacterium NC_groundwater_1444_Ag_S-0.65um_54_12]
MNKATFCSFLYVFLAGGSVIAAWAAAEWRWNGQFELLGGAEVTRSQVAALLPPPDQPLYLLDPVPIRRELETIPIVKTAVVRRWLFPSRLAIEIKERKPYAKLTIMPSANYNRYLDQEGYVFTTRQALVTPPVTVIASIADQLLQQRSDLVKLIAFWPKGSPVSVDARDPQGWQLLARRLRILIGAP